MCPHITELTVILKILFHLLLSRVDSGFDSGWVGGCLWGGGVGWGKSYSVETQNKEEVIRVGNYQLTSKG